RGEGQGRTVAGSSRWEGACREDEPRASHRDRKARCGKEVEKQVEEYFLEYFSWFSSVNRSSCWHGQLGDKIMPTRTMDETMDAFGTMLDVFDGALRAAHSRYRSYDPAILVEHDIRAQT